MPSPRSLLRSAAGLLCLSASLLIASPVIATSAPHLAHAALHLLPTTATPRVHAASRIGLVTLSNCDTNDCPPVGSALYYGGGLLIDSPKVYFVQFSSSSTGLTPATGYVADMFSTTEPNGVGAVNDIINSPYLDSVAAEYSSPGTGSIIQHGSFGGTLTLYNPTLATAATVSDQQIYTALQAASAVGQLGSYNDNAIFVTVFRAGQVITAGAGSSGTNFCAYHSAAMASLPATSQNAHPGTELNYVVLPNESSTGACNFAYTSNPFDSATVALSHELMETITDPWPTTGWVANDGDEIGDLCEYSSSATQVPTPAYGYYLQYEFSNLGKDCVALKTTAVLTATLSSATSSTVTVTAYLANGDTPIPGATLDLLSPSGIIESATTNASGRVVFTNAPLSGITVFYAGNAQVAGLSVTPGTAPTFAPTLESALPGDTQVTATWQPPTSNSGTPIARYVVSASPGNESCVTTATSCVVTGLTDGTTYQISVTGVSAGGLSPISNTLAATPATLPGQPTNLVATTGDARVALSWAAPTSTGGAPLTGYQVMWRQGYSPWQTVTVAPTTNSYTITGLVNGANYDVGVSAVNAVGIGPNRVTGATPETAPTVPGSPKAQASEYSAVVSWTASSLPAGYGTPTYTATATPGGEICTTTALTCEIGGLSPNTTYTISVTASAATIGTSLPATISAVTTLGPPSTPPAPSVTSLNKALVVRWVAGSASSYSATATAGSVSSSCTSASTSCVITGLTNTTTYEVTLRATNSYGSSSSSAPVTATPSPSFVWALSAPSSGLVGSHATVTLSVNAGLPVSTLPPVGTLVTLQVGTTTYTEPLSAAGTAAFSVPLAAGANKVTATVSAGPATGSPVTIDGAYGFGGYVSSSIKQTPTQATFSLRSFSGAFTTTQLRSLLASTGVRLQVLNGQSVVSSYACGLANAAGYLSCALPKSSHPQVIRVVTGSSALWLPVLNAGFGSSVVTVP